MTASWLLPDQRPTDALRAYRLLLEDYAIAPSLWCYEIRDLFVMNERRGRTTSSQSNEALSLLESLPIELDGTPAAAMVLDLARQHNLTVYDAAYLELALRRALPLASFDRQLVVAARAESVAVVGG